MEREYKIIRELEKFDNEKDKSAFKNFLYHIKAPSFFFKEHYCRKNIWIKFIMRDMITNDNVIKWLSDNDFCLVGDTFVKKELVFDPDISPDDNPYLNIKDTARLKAFITEEYRVKLMKIINENFDFDIDNYINMHVIIDIDVAEDKTGEMFKELTYAVHIQYWREDHYNEIKSLFKKWLITAATILCAFVLCATYKFLI